MKKYILIALFLFTGFTMQSQVLIALLLGDKLNTGNIEFGLDGGFNYSTILGMDSNNRLSSFNLGFYFDIKLKESWFLNTGVLVKSTLGLDELTDEDIQFLQIKTYEQEGVYSQKLSYFLVPALIKYKFKNNIYVEAGPQFGLLTNAWVEYNSEIDGNTARIKEKNKDKMNKFDMGLDIGTGYRLLKGMGWTIGVRYYYGLLDIYKDKSGSKNSSLFLKLNIPIGVSEETKNMVKEQKLLIKEKKAEKKEKRKEKKSKV